MADVSDATIFATIIMLILYVVGLVLFIASFEKIEIAEIGITFNTYTQTVDKEPYDSGRYFLGIGKKFLKYPRQLKSFDFSSDGDTAALSCWSSNGLNVYIDLTFYYKIEPNDVYRFFIEFGNADWQEIILRQAHAAIKDKTTMFSNEDFFINRGDIKQALFNSIKAKFYELTQGGVKLVDLFLRRITFDGNLEQELINKLIQLQRLRTYEIRRKSEQIIYEIEQIQQSAKNNITVIQAEKYAAATEITYSAHAQAFDKVIKQMAASYTSLNNDLGLSWDDDLLHFMLANEMPNLIDSVGDIDMGIEQAIVGSAFERSFKESYRDPEPQVHDTPLAPTTTGGDTTGESPEEVVSADQDSR